MSPLARLPRRDPPMRVPQPVPGATGLVVVDATWGKINPLELAPGVRTVAELELIEHLEAGWRSSTAAASAPIARRRSRVP
jgi:hypothetical protein